MASTHVGVVIAASRDAVVAFARDPQNLPRWASGLARGDVEQVGDDQVVVDSPMGRILVAFAPRNAYGVLDHDVTLPSGEVVHNPFRVLVHPDGAEAVFTLRQGDASDADLARDAAAVQEDLERLKGLLES